MKIIFASGCWRLLQEFIDFPLHSGQMLDRMWETTVGTQRYDISNAEQCRALIRRVQFRCRPVTVMSIDAGHDFGLVKSVDGLSGFNVHWEELLQLLLVFQDTNSCFSMGNRIPVIAVTVHELNERSVFTGDTGDRHSTGLVSSVHQMRSVQGWTANAVVSGRHQLLLGDGMYAHASKYMMAAGKCQEQSIMFSCRGRCRAATVDTGDSVAVVRGR